MSEKDSVGGQGEEVSRGDMTLVRRAIREEWSIPSDVRSRLIQRMAEYLESKWSRTVFAASKILIAADAVNVRRESLELQAALKKPDVVNDVSQNSMLILQSNAGEIAETQKLVQNRRHSRS